MTTPLIDVAGWVGTAPPIGAYALVTVNLVWVVIGTTGLVRAGLGRTRTDVKEAAL